MDIYWLEQSVSDVPAGDGWLSERERARLGGLRFPKRREEWRLGRWTAKCALACYWKRARDGASPARLELWPGAMGAPEVFLDGRPAAVAISLSHTHGRGLCAVAPAGFAVGCDLEASESRSARFLEDYFCAGEQTLVEDAGPGARDRLVNLLWSAKESALKALGVGLRWDTRTVQAAPQDFRNACREGWRPLSVAATNGRAFYGWWSESGDLIRTVVTHPPATRLEALRPLTSCAPAPRLSG